MPEQESPKGRRKDKAMMFYMDLAAMRRRTTDYTKKEKKVAYNGDGPSFAASRVTPRKRIGFAPGNVPAEKGLNNLSAAADEGRIFRHSLVDKEAFYPNEDASGRVHPEAVVMDRTGKITKEIFSDEESLYFDATRLSNTLRQLSHEAALRSWRLEIVLRNWRFAETTEEKIKILPQLRQIYRELNTFEVQTAAKVEDIINTISV